MKTLVVLVVLLLASISGSTVSSAGTSVGDVDHIGLTVTDLDASTEFFTRVLGFELKGRDDEYPAAFVSNGDVMVTLWRATEPAVDFNRKTNVGLHHLAFKMESFGALDVLHERLRNTKGVRIEFAPELLYGGPAKHMMIREPSGNRLEFIHRPPPPSEAAKHQRN